MRRHERLRWREKASSGRASHCAFVLLAMASAILFVIPAAALGGLNRWTSGGPEGGVAVVQVAFAASKPSTLYAATGGGIFRSSDGGATWSFTGGVPAGGPPFRFAVDPTDAAILYCVTEVGLHRSVNGGETWKTLEIGTSPAGDTELASLAVDPSSPSTVYVGTSEEGVGRIFKSADGGVTWSATGFVGSAVFFLLVDPLDHTVYATGYDGISKSVDGGSSWTPINTGLPRNTPVNAIARDPVHAGVLYAATGDHFFYPGGVFKSTDGGATWATAGTGLPPGLFASLGVDPNRPENIFAGSFGDGLFRSVDGGATWIGPIGDVTVPFVLSVVVDPEDSRSVYAGTYGGGVYKSGDGGATWEAENRGMRALVTAIAIDPLSASVVYAGTFGGGVYRSVNGGADWAPANGGLQETALFVSALAISPEQPPVLYAAIAGLGVFSTSNGGQTWETASEGLTGVDVRVLMVDPRRPKTIYAGTSGDGLFRSDDSGGSWRPFGAILSGGYITALAFDSASSDTLYVGRDYGLLKLTDDGTSWSEIGPEPPDYGFARVYALAADPSRPGVVYVGVDDGVFRTVDGGATWSRMGKGLQTEVRSLAVDPVDPTVVYAATTEFGVFRSRHNGKWFPWNRDLQSPSAIVLAIDSSGTRLHVGSLGGVWDYDVVEQPCRNLVCALTTATGEAAAEGLSPARPMRRLEIARRRGRTEWTRNWGSRWIREASR